MAITDENADVDWNMSLKDCTKDADMATILSRLNQAEIAVGKI